MRHQCRGCGTACDHASGQLVRRAGQWVCVSCYSRLFDGLSPEARHHDPQTPLTGQFAVNPVVETKVEPTRRPARRPASPQVPAVKVEPAKPLIGEPIFEDDEEFI